jgi:hypothetical protein
MNKPEHPLLWLTLPAVLIAGYLIVFQPGHREAPVMAAQETHVNTGAAPSVVEPARQSAVVNEAESENSGSSQEQEIEHDREFINYAFPLLSQWNLQEVKPLLAEETIAASSDETLSEVMSVLEDRLGELKSFETPQPVTPAAGEPGQDEAFDGKLQHYQFIAYYEAGAAEIDLILHKRQNASSLYAFNIHVPKQGEVF